MQVILLERIAGLGGLGDQVNVKPGYARNFLVPHGKALAATEANIARFEERRADLERQAADELVRAERRRTDIEELELVLQRRASNEGRLFGSVGTADIAEAVTEAGVEARRNEVRMPSGPIRQTGRYEVQLRVHPDVECVVRVAVIPIGGNVEDLDAPRGPEETAAEAILAQAGGDEDELEGAAEGDVEASGDGEEEAMMEAASDVEDVSDDAEEDAVLSPHEEEAEEAADTSDDDGEDAPSDKD